MQNYIINSFKHNNKKTLNDIYIYILKHCKNLVKEDLIKQIKFFIKKNIMAMNDGYYILTNEGTVILKDNIYYNSKIIYDFVLKKLSKKKYSLRETRLEQQSLRKYLIQYKDHKCIICNKNLPLCLLETAHLKPRCILNTSEINNYNVVEFMCRYCHKLFDDGLISVNEGLLIVSDKLKMYNLWYNNEMIIKEYNDINKIFFNFHYKYIFLK